MEGQTTRHPDQLIEEQNIKVSKEQTKTSAYIYASQIELKTTFFGAEESALNFDLAKRLIIDFYDL